METFFQLSVLARHMGSGVIINRETVRKFVVRFKILLSFKLAIQIGFCLWLKRYKTRKAIYVLLFSMEILYSIGKENLFETVNCSPILSSGSVRQENGAKNCTNLPLSEKNLACRGNSLLTPAAHKTRKVRNAMHGSPLSCIISICLAVRIF